MLLFNLAFKNIVRSRFRTWVTILAMAFAGAIMIFYASLLQGWLRAMEVNAVSMEMGELQMHASGYRDDPELYTVIPLSNRISLHVSPQAEQWFYETFLR